MDCERPRPQRGAARRPADATPRGTGSRKEREGNRTRERECEILTKSILIYDALTLEDFINEYNVSRERIRQIEVRAFEKLQKKMYELAQKEPA